MKYDGRALRCVKCVLPESLPHSCFNQAGQCYWCQTGFPRYLPRGEEGLEQALLRGRRSASTVDCVVGISGGKDSCYVLLQMVRRFRLRTEAFTYVHDGLTDFALANAREVCRSLGVKHHELGLPGHKHLELFKSFFAAWLESKTPLAAAMTCVACKHLYILGTRLAVELGAPFVVWAASPLEAPPFIPTQPASGSVNAESRGALGLAAVLGRNVMGDAGFRRALFSDLPTCFLGCLAFNSKSSFLGYRYPSVKQLEYFEFCKWDREDILRTLKRETPWRIPPTVVSDWHSDCLFNVFKEYMFQKMLGASYTDAFLSNQVRYGLLTRNEAWGELLRSKEYYAQEVPRVLSLLGLKHWAAKCDTSCFCVSEEPRRL